MERSLVKCLPEIVSSMGDEIKSGLTPEFDSELKAKALKDFKSNTSDTHREDKKRKVARKKTVKEKPFKKKRLVQARAIHYSKGVSLICGDVSTKEVTATFTSEMGGQETVSVESNSVLCSCDDHDKNYYCSEIIEFFKFLQLDDFVKKLKFSSEEFEMIQKNARERFEQIP